MTVARLSLLALFATGCATVPKGYTLEVANVPEGVNCVPVRGPQVENGCMPVWRLHANLDYLLKETLNQHLRAAADAGYRATFELKDVRFKTTEVAQRTLVRREAAFHFTLVDKNGATVVDLDERVDEAVPRLGYNHPLAGLMIAAPSLYQPIQVYGLFFDIMDQIGEAVDAALGLPPPPDEVTSRG